MPPRRCSTASPHGASVATADMGVAQAFQLLRACISMFAQGRDGGGEGIWKRFGPGDPRALRVLALSIEDARRTVSVLRGSPQPLVDGWVDSLRSRRDRLGELVEATRGPRWPAPASRNRGG